MINVERIKEMALAKILTNTISFPTMIRKCQGIISADVFETALKSIYEGSTSRVDWYMAFRFSIDVSPNFTGYSYRRIIDVPFWQGTYLMENLKKLDQKRDVEFSI